MEDYDPTTSALTYYMINAKIANELLWECNFSSNECQMFKYKSTFWLSVLYAWAELNFHNPETTEQIQNQVLWYNTRIRIKNKIVFFREWYEMGIFYVRDLVCGNRLYRYKEMKEVYGNYINVMKYNALISAIPTKWKAEIKYFSQDEPVTLYKYLIDYNKWSQITYAKLIVSNECIQQITHLWERKLGHTIEDGLMQKIFQNINKNVCIPKYRSFQYRLLHNAVYLNDRLVHLGISSTNLCYNCNGHKETYVHFFCECTHAKKIWTQLKQYLYENYNEEIDLDIEKIIFNNIKENAHCFTNLAVCITKQMLYAKKCLNKKLTMHNVIEELEFIHEIEKEKAYRTRNVKSDNLAWPDKIRIVDELQML